MTTNEKSLIRQLMQGPQFKVLEDLQKEIIDRIVNDTKVMNTEWETVRKTLLDQGQVDGINRFFKELYSTQL